MEQITFYLSNHYQLLWQIPRTIWVFIFLFVMFFCFVCWRFIKGSRKEERENYQNAISSYIGANNAYKENLAAKDVLINSHRVQIAKIHEEKTAQHSKTKNLEAATCSGLQTSALGTAIIAPPGP
jgi:hypothetical protein